MSNEPKLAYTVHHKGRKFTAGMTAEEVGPAAADLGDHVWEGGVRPDITPPAGAPAGGTPSGQPPVPTMSALPTAPPNPDLGDEPPADEPARKTAARRGSA